MSERRDIDHIRIARVNNHPSDVLRVFQSHVLPGLAAIERAIDAVAPGRALPIVGLTASNPDYVWVGRGNTEIADRRRALVIEDGFEGRAGVCGFPDATGRDSNVEGGTVA